MIVLFIALLGPVHADIAIPQGPTRGEVAEDLPPPEAPPGAVPPWAPWVAGAGALLLAGLALGTRRS